MIIETPEELRLHLPNHAYDDLESMFGAFRRSEADVLKEKIGTPLYREMIQQYEKNQSDARVSWLIQSDSYDPWAELTFLCQQVVVFDAFMRNADINAISVNQSGINTVSAENYDAASKDGIENYKRRLNKEIHAAVNRLLVWLEELSIEAGKDESDVEEDESDGSTREEEKKIVKLWQQSKYYYLVTDLFINTASMFNYYVDIYDSREKFINLLPDLRYCQRHYIENELGEELTATLLQKQMDGTANTQEAKLIGMIREALALATEARSQMFNRPEAKDEAIGSIARMKEYADSLNEQEEPEQPCPEECTCRPRPQIDAMLVTPVIY